MPTYTLEIEAYGIYTTNMPSLEIWEDGVLDSTYLISSSGSTISVTITYGGALPSSLALTFNDGFAAAGRIIEIRSVKINNHYVNKGNYLSTDSLVKSASATVDIASSSFIFDSSDPALSEFTTGATRTFTTGNDTLRALSGTTDEIFDALAGRDVFYLGSGNDKVFGNAGDDIIYAGAGNDLISGGDDNDSIYGGDGNDRLYGSIGDDRIHGEAGDDEIHGGAGDDRLNGHDGNDVITGGIGADKLNGGSGADYLFGEADNDSLVGGAGNDTLDGGAGNDLIYGGADDDIINGGDGDDILSGNTGTDIINGDAGNDTIYLMLNDFTAGERIYGGTGIDELILSKPMTIDFTTGVIDGLETLTGSDNDQDVTYKITQALQFTTIDLAGGTDNSRVNITGTVDVTVLGTPTVLNAENGFLTGSTGNDDLTISGAQLDALIFGGGTINFDSGTDIINLTTQSNDLNSLGSSTDGEVQGVETISYTASSDNITLDMSAQTEDFTLIGSTGRNTILGGSGDDIITGNTDDDTFTGGAGIDTITGDAGDDEFYLANGDFAAGESLDGGTGRDIIILTNATTVGFQTGTLTDIEEIEGSGLNDNVTVSATQYVAFNRDVDLRGGTDTFNVFADNSDISAFGDPAVITEIGNLIGDGADNSITLTGDQLDRIIVGTGIINLGAGASDTINLTSVSIDLNSLGSSSDAEVQGVETISYSASSDNLTLDMSAQSEDLILIGGTGRNEILGGNGDDTITGNADMDTLTGGVGSDLITGGAGNDIIYALDTVTTNDADRFAVNTLNGGNGNDNLYGSTGTDTLNGDAGDDILRSYSVAGASGTIVNVLISTGDDDSEEDIATGDISLNSTDLELGDDDFHGGPQLVGLRWQDINIAQGTIITSAYIEFNADESTSSAIDLTFYGEDIDSAAAFTATDFDISSRTTTTASVDWNSVPSWTAGAYYQTPDLSSIIQEVVDRGGWTSGSSDLAIIVSGTAGVERIAEAYEGDGQPARLVIEYGGGAGSLTILNGGIGNDTLYGGAGTDTLNGGDGDDELRSNSISSTATEDVLISASADDAEENISNGNVNLTSTDLEMVADGGTDQIVGLRWQNLDITQGVIITNAYIEFQADEADSSAINLTFHGEDIDSAAAFTTANSDISSRPTTSNSVTWNSVPSWTIGTTYQTPDLSSVIQEIIDRGGWTSGTSDLAIIVSGTAGAARVADSFNGNGTPARLIIEYTDSNSDVTTLNGQDGLDDLYGGAGIDHFVFESASAFNDVDTINGFDTTDYDALDISDVLIGFTAGVDDITDWVQITDDGTDSTLAIDANGTTGGTSYSNVATILGVTGLTDEAALEASGNIIA